MKGEMVSVQQDRVTPAVEMSRPIEVLIPAARERTRRRRTIIGLFITLALCATVFLLASSVRNVGPKPSATTSGAARQAAALGPACTLGNDITLTQFHQGMMSQNWWDVTFTNHSAVACSLRGDPLMQFVDGPARRPEGLPSQHDVSPEAQKMSLGLPAHGGTAIVVTTSEVPFNVPTWCGTFLPETGIDITFSDTTFFAATVNATSGFALQHYGACTRHPQLSYYYDVSV